jgi:hypothetical protein
MAKKGRRSTSSKRLARKTQKMMKSSCMWGGDSAHYSGSGSGATGYGAAIFGDRGEQVTNGMGSNNIKMNDPSLVWKGGQRGGAEASINIPNGITIPPGATNVKITWDEPASVEPSALVGGSRGGSMLGAAIVPAALLAANQLYKPTRAINNLSFGRKNGFKRTMKKFRKGKR